MTLGSLICEIRKEYSKNREILESYLHISAVRDFVERRGEDLEDFERLVKGYEVDEDILQIHEMLKKRGVASKFYGGICLKGIDYFKIPNKIDKILETKIEREAFFWSDVSVDTQNNFDSDFAIPDELDAETFDEFYGSEICEEC